MDLIHDVDSISCIWLLNSEKFIEDELSGLFYHFYLLHGLQLKDSAQLQVKMDKLNQNGLKINKTFKFCFINIYYINAYIFKLHGYKLVHCIKTNGIF